MKKTQFNQLFNTEINNENLPEHKSAWQKTQKKMYKVLNRKKRIKNIYISIAATFSILLGSIIISLPFISDALNPLISKYGDTSVQIREAILNKEEKEVPEFSAEKYSSLKIDKNKDYFTNQSKKEFVDFNLFQENVNNFPVSNLLLIPEELYFIEGYTVNSNFGTNYLSMEYKNIQGKEFNFFAQKLYNNNDYSYTMENTDYTYEKRILKNQLTAEIYVKKNNNKFVIYIVNDILAIKLDGDVSLDKAITYLENLNVNYEMY